MVKLTTTCTMELWGGFFGIDASGYQPECGHDIELDVEEECMEETEDGEGYYIYAVNCPKCKALLEWPQVWHKE